MYRMLISCWKHGLLLTDMKAPRAQEVKRQSSPMPDRYLGVVTALGLDG
jgi:hypothetical protein